MTTYIYEYQPLWYSYPCEPLELFTGLVVDQALGMNNTAEGEGSVTGEVKANSLRGAKMKASRLMPGANGGKWEKSYHLRRTIEQQDAGVEDYMFWCHVKKHQNTLYLWEKQGA